METIGTILFGLLFFGSLILIHECGHYFFARLFSVQIEELSVGFGPKLFQRRGRKTGIAYSLRAFPVGGYVLMEGENGGEKPHADDAIRIGEPFYKKSVGKRLVISAAGAAMNLLLGAVLLFALAVVTPVYGSTTVARIPADSVLAGTAIRPGDTITAVNGNPVFNSDDLVYEIAMTMGRGATVSYTHEGQKCRLTDIAFQTGESGGHSPGITDFYVLRQEKSFGQVLKRAAAEMRMSVKMVFDSIGGMLRGDFSLRDLSGPLGVTKAIGDAAKSDAAAAKDGMKSYALLQFCAIISVNLGIMNLLPLPALDGGRILLLLIEGIFRKKLPDEAEAFINLAGLAALLLLSAVIAVQDIFSLF